MILFGCLPISTISAHPQDEDIVLDIEEGEVLLQKDTLDKEYQAALKRKRLRKLAVMSWQEKFWLYTQSGFEHIIPKGMDHILFVLGLYFACLSLSALLWQITAFTLAHSITLGLAAFGLVSAPSAIVEPLIALSIVWIGVENCFLKQPARWRFALVFGFGLLHGLGFASVLSDYGLPKDNLLAALFAFNLGVEIGQLAVISFAFMITVLITKKHWYRNAVQIPVSAIISGIGAFWLLQRV